ncbi:PLD nuclease N-terminal domain-containing protein [Williamsia sp. 1138]|uniref:PLD nuclease N-terminal domain-containing protein n=1 Tax=Williamsia sp. 1138 TaxID=1903117 RepID=UPI00267932EB
MELAWIGSPGLSYASVAIALMLLALVIGLIDVLCRDDTGVRLMPRWAWFLVVVAVPIVGTLVWLVFGRPRARRVRRRGAWWKARYASGISGGRLGISGVRQAGQVHPAGPRGRRRIPAAGP